MSMTCSQFSFLIGNHQTLRRSAISQRQKQGFFLSFLEMQHWRLKSFIAITL